MDGLLTLEEAAARLRQKPGAVRRAAEVRALDVVFFGREMFFSERAVREFEERHTVKALPLAGRAGA